MTTTAGFFALAMLAAGPAHFSDGMAVSPDSKQVAYGWYNEGQFYELRSVALGAAPPRIVYDISGTVTSVPLCAENNAEWGHW